MSDDDRRLRSDNRHNHLSSQEVTRRASGPVKHLTPEEIATMDPAKPTPTKRILVDQLPREPETLDRSIDKVREALQSTLSALHRVATKDLQLLDEGQVRTLNMIAATLIRIKKMSEDGPIDPSKLSDEELARLG